ncbi:MAG: dipeptidyl-peptidase 3 family protein [Candidatus Binataceae bacterium]
MRAAKWIDRIYWKQRSGAQWPLWISSGNQNSENGSNLKRLLHINFGPWDTLGNDEPFLDVGPKPPGGELYPKDLSREEFDLYLAKHPEKRKSLMSHTTVVLRDGEDLIPVPYEIAYREELAKVALHLKRASQMVSYRPFRDFLIARAKGLMTGSLSESECLWIDASESPVDIAIGPYEVYDDGLLGVKASYEATVMVRHPMTEQLAQFESVAQELASSLPGSVESAETRRRFAVGVYDVAYAAGMTNMGAKAMAATLPNDEAVRSRVGARLMLFRNVISAKFAPILKPLAIRLLRSDQVRLVREDAFVYHTLLHEMAHALSSCYVREPKGGPAISINEALRERYATIEECRADLLGMVFLNLLAEQRFLLNDMKPAAAVTFVVNCVRSLRFGMGDDYSRGAAVILSYFKNNGSLNVDRGGRLSVNYSLVERHVRDLAGILQGIATSGDYQGAGVLIDKYGSIPEEIDRLRTGLEDIPLDLEFLQENL